MEHTSGSMFQQPFPARIQSRAVSLAPVPPQPDCVQSTKRHKTARLAFQETQQLDKLGKNVIRDMHLVQLRGLTAAFGVRRQRNDWGMFNHAIEHPAHRLLQYYKTHGAPVTLADSQWSQQEKDAAMARGPHKSAYEFQEFLREDMADYVAKGFWMVLPYSLVATNPHLRVSPIGVVPQNNRRPRPIVDYSYYGVNDATQPNAPMDAMQFGRALERIIRKILLANPKYGKVHLIKVDLSDGFYRINLNPRDAVKLAVAFPSLPGEPPLVALPLSLPMGWKNSPPLFCAATETIADIANHWLLHEHPMPPHRLDHLADSKPTDPPPLLPAVPTGVPVPICADPHLARTRRRRLQTIEIYVDDFIGAAQGRRSYLQRVRRTLLHAVDDIFRPLDARDGPERKEPVSLKKLRQGDACWSTCKEILGWLLDTDQMTLTLTERRTNRLHALLFDEFPPGRKRARVADWHRLLGELRSMTLALPGSRGLFSVLQHTLRSATAASRRVALTETVQSILDDFRELYSHMHARPTRLQELVPLTPTLHGNHDAAGLGAGGVWYPTSTAVPRRTALRMSPNARKRTASRVGPIVWRMRFPRDIQARLASWSNPRGDITNTDLELVGSVLQQECAAQCFDIRERTTLSRTDNTGTLYWQRKGSTTTSKPAAEILRLQALHQRFHRYVHLHDYLPGPLNQAADDASRLHHLSNKELLSHFNSTYPQTQSWQIWTPTPAMRSSLIGALRNMRQPSELFLVVPPPPIPIGLFGQNFAPTSPSTHFLKTSKTQLSSFKSSSTVTAQDALRLEAELSEHAPLRMPYVVLAKRSLQWGPRIPDTRRKANWISVLPAKSVSTRNRILHPTV